jgi:hypothetical protein
MGRLLCVPLQTAWVLTNSIKIDFSIKNVDHADDRPLACWHFGCI